MILQAVLTGSRVYGNPRPNSDVDLIIRVSDHELAILTQAADAVFNCKENNSRSLKFGNLNLICVTSDQMFHAWIAGTQELVKKAPVTRDDAILLFETKGIKPITEMSNFIHYNGRK